MKENGDSTNESGVLRRRVEKERECRPASLEQELQSAAELASALQRERDTLQAIMDGTHAQMAYLDPQFDFLRVNSAYILGSGHSREELIGRNHFVLFPHPENQAIFGQVRETGQPVEFHARPFEFADQPERGITYWDWTLVPIKDREGHVQGLLLSLLEVTEQQRAKQALQRALELSRQHQAEISALSAVSRAILGYREFKPTAQFIFDSCKHLTGATAGYVVLLSKDGKEYDVTFLDSGGVPCTVDPTLPMPIRGLREQAYRTGKAVYENDFARSEWPELLPEGHVVLDNVLFAPLLINGIAVGLLGLANKPGGFTQDDVRIASMFSELAALALLNSRALESLRSGEERFRSVAETAADAIITVDSHGRIVFWNKAAATIFGHAYDEAMGKPLALIIPERLQAAHQTGLDRVVSTGEARVIGRTVEMVGRRRDGREFPVELALSRWETREGTFFTGIVRDITERVRSEATLRESEAKWHSLVGNAPNFITIVDRDGIVEFINHTVPGTTPQDVIGNSVYDFVQPEYRDLAKHKIASVFESGNADFYMSAALGPDGTVAWYENHLGPIKQDAQVIAVTIIGNDITERKQAEETIQSLARFPSENRSPVIRVAQDGTILYANEASAPLLASWACRVGQELPDTWRLTVVDAIHSGESLTREVVCADRFFSVDVTPVPEADYANLYGRDITERREAEETIKSLARFPSENRSPVIRVAQDGRILYANEASAPLLALWACQVGRQLPDAWRQTVVDAIRTGRSLTREAVCEDRIFSVDVTPVPKADYANLYGRDITERREAEELLREQHRFVTTVFESLSHPFYVIDANDYTIQMANSAVRTDEQSELVTCYALTHYRDTPCDGAEHLCPLEEVKRTGKPAMTEHVHFDKEGNRRIFQVHGHPILDSEGNVSQVIEYTLDITERVRAEEALRRAHDELEGRVQERTAELAIVNEQLQAAAAQKTELYEAERHARHIAETLSAASLALTQTLDLDVVMDTLLDYLCRLVPCDSTSLVLLQDEARLVVRAARGYERWMDPQELLGQTVDAQANPYINQLLTEQKSVLIADAREHPGWRHFAGIPQVLSWLGVPLIAGDRVIGLCGLDKVEQGSFTQQHARSAEALVSQATVAIQNAWLFEQVRGGRERLRALSHRLVEVQETDRRYIARELHDEAGQALTSLMVGLRLLEREAEHPEAIVAGVAELKGMVDNVLEDLHRLAADLRPASLDHLGLVAALRQYVEAVSDRHSLVVQFEAVGLDDRLPPDVEIALYRIVQEALTNVVRHAQATRVDVLLSRRDDKLIVIVEDNGIGFDFAAALQSGRLGLFGMRERTEMLGGTLIVESTAGAGATVYLEVPYADSDTHRG